MHHSITNILLVLGMTILFKLLLLTRVQLLQCLRTERFLITSKNLFKSSCVVLVSTYCQFSLARQTLSIPQHRSLSVCGTMKAVGAGNGKSLVCETTVSWAHRHW